MREADLEIVIERFYGYLKRECIRPQTPVLFVDTRCLVGRFVDHYNHERFHSVIGYVAPAAVLEGRAAVIHADRPSRPRRNARPCLRKLIEDVTNFFDDLSDSR